jgi:hypothetical protein
MSQARTALGSIGGLGIRRGSCGRDDGFIVLNRTAEWEGQARTNCGW